MGYQIDKAEEGRDGAVGEEVARERILLRLPRERNRIERTTPWSTTLSSKVNLHHAINVRALRGANLVT